MVTQVGWSIRSLWARLTCAVEAAIGDPAAWRPPAAERMAGRKLRGVSSAALKLALDQLDALNDAEGPLLSSSPTWRLKLHQLAARLRRVVDRLPLADVLE